MNDGPDERDDDGGEPRLMSRIDGEEVRLLVHIEPIAGGVDDATDATEPAHAPRPESPGLTE